MALVQTVTGAYYGGRAGRAAVIRPNPDGTWRAYVNEQLDGPYQELFGRLHDLVLLQPPGFAVVAGWRAEQEATLRAKTGQGMSEAEIGRFIAHYERRARSRHRVPPHPPGPARGRTG